MGKYDRVITNKEGESITVDVYDVIDAFGVKCPAVQHLAKKALCTGLRGHKDEREDLGDIESAAKRAIQLYHSRQAREEDPPVFVSALMKDDWAKVEYKLPPLSSSGCTEFAPNFEEILLKPGAMYSVSDDEVNDEVEVTYVSPRKRRVARCLQAVANPGKWLRPEA